MQRSNAKVSVDLPEPVRPTVGYQHLEECRILDMRLTYANPFTRLDMECHVLKHFWSVLCRIIREVHPGSYAETDQRVASRKVVDTQFATSGPISRRDTAILGLRFLFDGDILIDTLQAANLKSVYATDQTVRT